MATKYLLDVGFRTDWDDVRSFRLLDVPVLFPAELARECAMQGDSRRRGRLRVVNQDRRLASAPQVFAPAAA
jgi:hypothetical protein